MCAATLGVSSGVTVPPAELVALFGDRDGTDVTVTRLYDPVASASLGIWRVTAGAQSAVLKLIAHSEGGHANWQSGGDPAHWYYWRREVCAYEGGLLESLPDGVRAPRRYLVAPREDGSIALWMEDLGDRSASRWTLERYDTAARHFGEMQGSFLTTVPLPDAAWLSRGWLEAYLTQREGDLDLLDSSEAWRDERIAEWFPDPPVDRAKAMRHDQPRLLDALRRLPPTLCHLDLHPANLFDDDRDRTVAIDWSFVGIGNLGEDVGNLVTDAVLDFHVGGSQIDELYERTARGYEVGLRAAGWGGPSSAVRLGMAATIAAKYAWILPALLRAAVEHRDTVNGRPLDETIRWWAPAIWFILERADEARALATQV
jgi:hypothetical protein